MKVCNYCGRENEAAATHCRECGNAEFKSAGSVPPTPPVERETPVKFIPRTLSSSERQQSFATLQTCRTLEEADWLVTQLDAAGIEALIPDEGLMQAAAWNANTYGYVRVQVPTWQYDEAVEFLKDSEPGEGVEAGASVEMSQERFPILTACFLLMLPATCLPGLVFAGMIRASYLKRGCQRWADEVWKYFFFGLAFWLLAFILLSIIRGR